MLEKYLQELGLNEKEATIYLALLQYDDISVLDLSKKTGLNRSTAYVVLESLMKKGLVSEVVKGKKTHYQAEQPERLETYIERQKLVFEERAKRIKDIIPQLKSVQRETGEKPEVKYFEGREGIISATEELYRGEHDGEEKMYIIYPRDLVQDIFTSNDLQKQRSNRIDRKIKSKSVYTYSQGDFPSDETGQRLKIDGKKYPISCDIAVYKDRVRISILGDKLFSLFIRSADLAQTLRSLVDYIHDLENKK